MRPTIRLMTAFLLLAVASCGTAPEAMTRGGSPLIDEPSPPFPYNSRFCP
jgi:hypothetical protein